MAMQPFPFSGSGRADGAGQRLAFDNLIRRELKVGDPSDAHQVARALLDRYQTDPRARSLSQEAAGLPFLQGIPSAPSMLPVATATNVDLDQAVNDVNQDLEHLMHSNLLKDVQPELSGWAQAIRSAMAEGAQSARFGLDTQQRDKAFGIRRQLGDYARMARLIGALTPAVNYDYRNLAQSLDELSSVILVLMGESLANTGMASGRFMLQAPYSELQVRRDAVVYALRNLVGSTQESYGQNEWPRGLDAYRRLYDALETQGQGDLRSLLVENELIRVMDELVQRTAQGTAQGLRAVGSTAQIDLQRFGRLVAVGRRLVTPESPPLATFLQALSLFSDAFQPAGGFRLLRVARPSILYYGLYGIGEDDPAEQRLAQLVVRRGIFASQLDCLMRCTCDAATVLAQIALDKVLYQLDRAIDLYAVGELDFGAPEARASATAYLLDGVKYLPYCDSQLPNCVIPTDLRSSMNVLRVLLRPTNHGAENMFWGVTAEQYDQMVIDNTALPRTTTGLRDLLRQELCLQHEIDDQWRSLVESMAPSCVPSGDVFDINVGVLPKLVRFAVNLVRFGNDVTKLNTPLDCGILQPDIPAHFETSLGALVFDFDADGKGRGSSNKGSEQ